MPVRPASHRRTRLRQPHCASLMRLKTWTNNFDPSYTSTPLHATHPADVLGLSVPFCRPGPRTSTPATLTAPPSSTPTANATLRPRSRPLPPPPPPSLRECAATGAGAGYCACLAAWAVPANAAAATGAAAFGRASCCWRCCCFSPASCSMRPGALLADAISASRRAWHGMLRQASCSAASATPAV